MGHVFIRTVTFFYIGEMFAMDNEWFILKKASWIVRTGHFSKFVRDGVIEEYEKYPEDLEVKIRKKSVIEMFEWKHGLPA